MLTTCMCSDGRDGLVVSGYYMVCHFLLQLGWTSLILASGGGYVECIRTLLEAGAQANQQDMVSCYNFMQCLIVVCGGDL